ncbi:MAG: isoprenylcysteine carboxylmethyltransferase family protein [Planctomycetes bacterium]|nr:isoprenylcysteine carboxylmethyltransferase family protein [Planctomycetota bacterium]
MDKKYYIGRFLVRYRWAFYIIVFLPMVLLKPPADCPINAYCPWLGWVIGGLLVFIGCGIRIYAARYIGWKGKPGDPLKRQLATGGPYKYTRNPLYWGNIIGFGGAAIVFRVFWYAPVSAFAIFLLHHILITWYEEKRMLEKCGQEYEDFKKTTPRWGPKLFHKKTEGAVDEGEPLIFPWGRVLMAELGTIGGFVGVFVVAIIKEVLTR